MSLCTHKKAHIGLYSQLFYQVDIYIYNSIINMFSLLSPFAGEHEIIE